MFLSLLMKVMKYQNISTKRLSPIIRKSLSSNKKASNEYSIVFTVQGTPENCS